jgi:hypothetical protein
MAEILCFESDSGVFLVLKFAFLLDIVLIRRPGLRLLQFPQTYTPTKSDCFEPGLEEATWSLQETDIQPNRKFFSAISSNNPYSG